MDERALHDRLARRLKMGDVPEPVWKRLVDGWYVQEALAGGAEEFDQLVRTAKDLLGFVREMNGHRTPPGRSVAAVEPPPPFSAYEAERAATVWADVARQSAAAPRVRGFRERFLGERTLSRVQARQMLASPAPRILTGEVFEKRGIPIVGHRSSVVDRSQGPTEDGRWFEEVTLRFDWTGGAHEEAFGRWHSPVRPPQDKKVAFLDEQRETHEVPIWPYSVFDKLRDLCEWLAKWHGWRADQAAWFVLTGDPVPWLPLQVGVSGHLYPSHEACRVTLSVEPWVPADTVLRVYRDVQQRLLGRDNRPVGERSLALVRLAAEQGEEWEGLTWSEAMARWNRVHPEWYYEHERRFARDVRRARQALLFPRYRFAFEQGEGDAS